MEKSIQTWLNKFKDSESSTSIIFGAIVVVAAGILLVNFFKANKPSLPSDLESATESAAIAAGATATPSSYVVKKGDHLWGIAEKMYGSGYNWVDIAKANKGSNHLVAGMELTIPKVEAKKATIVKTETVITAAATESAIKTDSYEVVKGDSLWSIAVRAYGDGYKWTAIYKANPSIGANPGIIKTGQKLTLPR